jgi:hypothetical protein
VTVARLYIHTYTDGQTSVITDLNAMKFYPHVVHTRPYVCPHLVETRPHLVDHCDCGLRR